MLVVCALLCGQVGLAAEPDAALRGYLAAAGAARVNPPAGAYLAGYDTGRRATGVHDDLWLKVVLVDDGRLLLAVMTLDNIGLTRPDIQRIAGAVRRKHPRARLIFSSTHTHAGPDVVGIWGSSRWSSGRDENYIDGLVRGAIQLVDDTVAKLQPVRSRVASADLALDWVKNLSEPDLLDPRMSVLQFVNNQGISVATLTNFACHPTVLGPANTRVSADYVAGFYAAMSAGLPGEHLFLQGAVGGWVQPLHGDRSTRLALALGEQVAGRALHLLTRAEDNPAAPLRFKQRELSLDLDNRGFQLLMGLGILPRPVQGNLFRPRLQTEVAYFTIGGVPFVTHPGESSPAYSLASRELLGGEHHFVLGLSQDALGYILKPDYFQADAGYPHGEYLTSVSVGPTAGPRMMAALEALITGAAVNHVE